MMQKGCVIFSIPKSVVWTKMVYVVEEESFQKENLKMCPTFSPQSTH